MMKRLSIAAQQQETGSELGSGKRLSLSQQQTTGGGNTARLLNKRISIAFQPAASTITASSEMGDSTFSDSSKAGPRPSLANVMLARKFGKRLSTKIQDRRTLGTIASSSTAGFYEKEPTYRMEPTKVFSALAAEKIIKDVLHSRLDECKYSAKLCSNMTKIISDDIKDKVKGLGFDRYKIICMVVLCQKSEQEAVCSSRCIMDKKNDTFATYTLKNQSLICNATVYALYRE